MEEEIANDEKSYVSTSMHWTYVVEQYMYGIAFLIGIFAFCYTLKRLRTKKREVFAARLLSYKLSLLVADVIILFIYAPTQFLWIYKFWWYAGDVGCRLFKFISIFGFHLTVNMQVLIAIDLLYITATLRQSRSKHQNDFYNSRACIAVVWVISFLCSLPQLLIFGEAISPNNLPQCVSIWYRTRVNLEDQRAYIFYLNRHSEMVVSNGTGGTDANLSPYSPTTMMSLSEIETRERYWTMLEQIYNMFHLSTLCVVPYTTLVVCYALILYILKGATRGNFLTVRQVVGRWAKYLLCICCCLCFLGQNGKRRNINSGSDSAESSSRGVKPAIGKQLHSSVKHIAVQLEQIDEEYQKPVNGNKGNVQSVKIAAKETATGSSGTLDDLNGSMKGSEDVCKETLPLCQDSSEQTLREQEHPVYSTQTDGAQNGHEPELIPNKNKRHSSPSSIAPWVHTVDTARQRAKKKAFCMLSLNLLFWAPYCLLGIVNSATVFEYYNRFQFVSALVVFNAISNILL